MTDFCYCCYKETNHGHFEKLHNLKLLSGIDDSELLNLYQTCGVLFLPLNGFTANNALLEGASCGCPVVVASDQKSESCYFNYQLVDFVPFDPNRAVDSIIMRLNHSDESGRISNKFCQGELRLENNWSKNRNGAS